MLCVIASQCGNARAQDSTALTLARACVAEIGIEGRDDECLLMWSILRAKGGSVAKVATQYNTLLRRNNAADPRAWVLALNAQGTKPNGWPSTMSWALWRGRWLDKLATAEKFLAAKPKHPCPAATHYGGRCDDDKHACDAVPSHWRRELCGQPLDYFAQAYWSVPRRGKTISADAAGGGKP